MLKLQYTFDNWVLLIYRPNSFLLIVEDVAVHVRPHYITLPKETRTLTGCVPTQLYSQKNKKESLPQGLRWKHSYSQSLLFCLSISNNTSTEFFSNTSRFFLSFLM